MRKRGFLHVSLSMGVYRHSKAFTLIELLVTIAIVAALTALALFFVASYISWAQKESDHQTYVVLNDALTRYKCEGGNLNALTLGAPLTDVFAALQTPVAWGGSMQHQFLNTGFTYPGRSLTAVGNGATYQFYQVNSYVGTSPAPGTPTSGYPYGQGVGYISNGGAATYSLAGGTGTISSTGHIAAQDPSGNITFWGNSPTLPAASYYKIWACTSGSNSTPGGTMTSIMVSSSSVLTSVDLHGLTGLQYITLQNNPITSLVVKQCTGLIYLHIGGAQITSVDVSGLAQLTNVDVGSNPNVTLNVSGCTALQTLTAYNCGSPTFAWGSSLPYLSSIDIRICGLNASQLNAIYTLLPDRTSLSAGSISSSLNPSGGNSSGTNGATPSIATAKNWSVH